ncbi:hypothetical protein Q5P01_005959 [Channa striata]|uniref:Uncharacterized protein n=1 Tax=Channa striata TaxID=64152 RepID=A0AA88NEJ8_CHASR|nr:hypothetical protein Q5P01_005959 [Channa striata]
MRKQESRCTRRIPDRPRGTLKKNTGGRDVCVGHAWTSVRVIGTNRERDRVVRLRLRPVGEISRTTPWSGEGPGADTALPRPPPLLSQWGPSAAPGTGTGRI